MYVIVVLLMIFSILFPSTVSASSTNGELADWLTQQGFTTSYVRLPVYGSPTATNQTNRVITNDFITNNNSVCGSPLDGLQPKAAVLGDDYQADPLSFLIDNENTQLSSGDMAIYSMRYNRLAIGTEFSVPFISLLGDATQKPIPTNNIFVSLWRLPAADTNINNPLITSSMSESWTKIHDFTMITTTNTLLYDNYKRIDSSIIPVGIVSDFIVQITMPRAVYNKLSIGVSVCGIRPNTNMGIDGDEVTPIPIRIDPMVLDSIPARTKFPTPDPRVTFWKVPSSTWDLVRKGSIAGLVLRCTGNNTAWCWVGMTNAAPVTVARRALMFDRKLNAAAPPTCVFLLSHLATLGEPGSNWRVSWDTISPEHMGPGHQNDPACSDYPIKSTSVVEFHVNCIDKLIPEGVTIPQGIVLCPENLFLSGNVQIVSTLNFCIGRNYGSSSWGGGTACRQNYIATETALVTRRSPTVTNFPTATAVIPPTVTRRNTPIPSAPPATQTAYINYAATATAFTRAVQTAAAATNQVIRTREAATLTAIRTPTVAVNSTQTRAAELAQTAIAQITQTNTSDQARATRVTDAAAITGSDTSVIGVVSGAVAESSVSTGLTEVTDTYIDVINSFATAANDPNSCSIMAPPISLPQQNKFGINPYNTITRFSDGLCIVRGWLFDWWFSAVIRTIISVLLILWLLYVVYMWIITRSK